MATILFALVSLVADDISCKCGYGATLYGASGVARMIVYQ